MITSLAELPPPDKRLNREQVAAILGKTADCISHYTTVGFGWRSGVRLACYTLLGDRFYTLEQVEQFLRDVAAWQERQRKPLPVRTLREQKAQDRASREGLRRRHRMKV